MDSDNINKTRGFVLVSRKMQDAGVINRIVVFVAILAWMLCAKASAGDFTVAVAANFTGTVEKLQLAFAASHDHSAIVISGSTGKLAAQITEGAPFDVFLSADDRATAKLVEEGQAVAESEFTYAIGTLALFSADAQLIGKNGAMILKEGDFAKLAIANPKTAPYGVAALQTMKSLGLAEALQDKIVMGENIAQAFQMVDTGNAQLGLVALSQVLESPSGRKGSFWNVPESLHDPIRQNAVLLTRAKQNSAALAFLEFLRSTEAREIIGSAGYSIED